MSQATKQGITESRALHLNKFALVMADIRIKLHPASQSVPVRLHTMVIDHYRDTETSGLGYIKANINVLVFKDFDLAFMQQDILDGVEFDDLLETSDTKPWLMCYTLTGLTRALRADDDVLLTEGLFKVSKVRLHNRLIDSIQYALIYRDRLNLPTQEVTDDEYKHDIYDTNNPLPEGYK